jgi:hypothetical protein
MWSWTALRPSCIFGFAVGNPMNMATVIAIYATMCKEMKLPLRFPGSNAAYHALMEMTDAELLAKERLDLRERRLLDTGRGFPHAVPASSGGLCRKNRRQTGFRYHMRGFSRQHDPTRLPWLSRGSSLIPIDLSLRTLPFIHW